MDNDAGKGNNNERSRFTHYHRQGNLVQVHTYRISAKANVTLIPKPVVDLHITYQMTNKVSKHVYSIVIFIVKLNDKLCIVLCYLYTLYLSITSKCTCNNYMKIAVQATRLSVINL